MIQLSDIVLRHAGVRYANLHPILFIQLLIASCLCTQDIAETFHIICMVFEDLRCTFVVDKS